MAEFTGSPDGEGRRFAVLVSRFNEHITQKLADGDERIVALTGQQPARGDGQLPRARHPDHIDVVGANAVAHERVQRTIDELLDDRLIESTGNDGKASVLSGRRAREFGH